MEATSALQRAVLLTPNGHAVLRARLDNLAISFARRFEYTGNLPDISEAISLQRRALKLAPGADVDIPAHLNNLGSSFQCRFGRTGDHSDILEAISFHEQSVQLTFNGHIDMPGRLTNLATALMHRFELTGDLTDISKAISAQQRAVLLTHDDDRMLPVLLNDLGVSFWLRFQRTGNLTDITEAISLQQRAIEHSPSGYARRQNFLTNLGNSLRSRFQHSGNISDIDEAISVQQLAAQLMPNDHIEMPRILNNLGISLQSRFKRAGNLLDNSEAISVMQRAIKLIPDGHADRPRLLTNLGTSLWSRFEHGGDLSDNSEAIYLHRQAVKLTPHSHAEMAGRLHNLGCALSSRSERTGDLRDISEAISALRRAVRLAPGDHADMPIWLNELGVSFQLRFQHTHDISDISEAISLKLRAIQHSPKDHAHMPERLANLGNAILIRFQRTGSLSDISIAISFQRLAVQFAPNNHANMPGMLFNLAVSIYLRFERTGDLNDIYSALSLYQKSATSKLGRLSHRLIAANHWGILSSEYVPLQCVHAYQVAIDLVSQIAGLHRTIEQRHSDLIGISTLTTTAASAAFTQDEVEKALEWLEQGRCLVWSQLNQLRTPVDILRVHDQQLAQRFLEISSALEASGSRRGLDSLETDGSMSQKMILHNEAHVQVKLAREWNHLLNKIRLIPVFHDFLRPRRASDLLANLPVDGPVILVNVQVSRCDGLALLSGSDVPIHIPLPNFSHKLATELRERLRKFLLAREVRTRAENRGPRPVLDSGDETQSVIHVVLEALWLNVVKPILDALAYSVSLNFSEPMAYFLINFLFQVSCPVTPTSNMVVSNWSPCIPSTSCRWNLQSRRATPARIMYFRLCGIVIYTHRQRTAREGKGVFRRFAFIIVQASYHQPTKHTWTFSNPWHHTRNECHRENGRERTWGVSQPGGRSRNSRPCEAGDEIIRFNPLCLPCESERRKPSQKRVLPSQWAARALRDYEAEDCSPGVRFFGGVSDEHRR